MAWIPGVSTLDLSALWRAGNSPISVNTEILNNLQNRTGYTMQRYFSPDIFTLQNAALALIRQPITQERQNLTNVPSIQIGDIMANRDRGG